MKQQQSTKGNAPEVTATEASSVKNPLLTEGINMSDCTDIQSSSQPPQQVFNFEGHPVRVFSKEGEPWFVASDLCAALNLTNSRVALKALADDEKGVSSTYTHGGEQQLAVVSEGGMWTLVLRCRDAVIEGTAPYRVRRWVTNEVLPAVRKTGVYVGKPFAVNPDDVLTQEEQNTLRMMLKSAAEHLPKTEQGKMMMQGWSKLKAHFKVSYREIPRNEFSEAVSIVARHTAEWELVDEGHADKTTLGVSIEELTQQVETGSGVAPAQLMPLVNAVLRKQGFNLGMPAAQSHDIAERIDRLESLFHPLSPQFSDVVGIRRALSGLNPKLGSPEHGYCKLISA